MKPASVLLLALVFIQSSCGNANLAPKGYGAKCRYAIQTNTDDKNGFLVIDTSADGRHAFVQVINNKDITTDTATLEYTEIKPVMNPQSANQLFEYSIDRSAGFGSYSGLETEIFTIDNGKIKWQSTKDSSGKERQIHLLSSLKSWWKLLPTNPPQILEVDCRPDFNKSTADSAVFKIIYTRYKQQGTFWAITQREENGFIEFESETATLPEALFPTIR